MLLHIGDNTAIPLERLLLILNENGMMPLTRAYVERAKKEHRYMRCAGGRAKSYAIVREHGREVVYESILASSTLEKRLRDEVSRKYLAEQAVILVEDI